MTIADRSRLGWAKLADVDPELWTAMVGERDRQHWKIELIASENYTFAAVMEAQGSWLTNKYAEGLPGKRYYGGCEFVDVVERLAQDRALALFPGAEHVNVQPHAGAQANFAAYFAVLDPGDRVMGLNLSHGGHLTHGMALNFSRPAVRRPCVRRDRETERFDYDEIERRRSEVRPEDDRRGGQAYPRIIDFERLGRDRPRGRRAALRRHGAHRRARRGGTAPDARSGTRTSSRRPRTRRCAGRAAGYLQPARPAGGHRPRRFPQVKTTLAAAIDRAVFPGLQGGPLMHVIAAEGRLPAARRR